MLRNVIMRLHLRLSYENGVEGWWQRVDIFADGLQSTFTFQTLTAIRKLWRGCLEYRTSSYPQLDTTAI